MTATVDRPIVARVPVEPLEIRPPRGSLLTRLLRTTDPKEIGIMYIVTSLAFFVIGGLMALLIRAEIALPGMDFLSFEQFNQLFTMHGTVMLLFFTAAIVYGFGNLLIPVQIGAPHVAFPRLNAASYWFYLFGAITTMLSFLTPNGAPEYGWTAYPPLSTSKYSVGAGADLWIMGIGLFGIAMIIGAVNFVTTILCLRAPGMTMWRMSIFTWNMFMSSILALVAYPILMAALLGLEADRQFGSHVFDPGNGGAILFQHLLWLFGHDAMYVVVLPFFGIATEIIPVFARKPLFGYPGLVFATIVIASMTTMMWAHHLMATGAILLPYFSFMSLLIAIPTGIKFFTWIGTMWRGQITFETPMLFTIGFMFVFLFGGLTGIIVGIPALDWHVHDTYFVVAHFHYTLFGSVVFMVFGGIYFWFPKFIGRFLDERLGKLHFWLTFIGFNGTFLIQHWLGNMGMARRYPDYLPTDGFTGMNTFSTVASFVLGASMIAFIWNIIRSYRYGERTVADDPWGYGNSLEWATSSPPPKYNFTALPRIRSERPAFELHHPWLADRLHAEGKYMRRRDWAPPVGFEFNGGTHGSANGTGNGAAHGPSDGPAAGTVTLSPPGDEPSNS